MDNISLYRKWRPQAFAEVVGQEHVTTTLSNALENDRLVHAYLFCGPRGTGKTSTARILAKAINCVEGPTATPCNVCDACVSISEGSALDVIEIDAASNRKIDEIRDLLEKIPYAPTALRSKVYIVDEVHQLTPEASSALLKTLEEPPGHVTFVLATTEAHKILPTIISRCQRFDFSLVTTPEISALLGRIAESEAIDIEPEAVGMIAEHAHGSVRDAIGVMDQIANLTGERVTQGDVASLLGEVETGLIFEMVDMIAARDTAGALELVGRMVESGKDPRRFVESLISHLRSVFLIQNAANPKEIVVATDEHYERLKDQAGRMRRYEVIRLIERLGDTHREMRWSETPRLVLECALVKAARLDVDVSVEGLMFRVDELERKLEGSGAQRPAGQARGDAPESVAGTGTRPAASESKVAAGKKARPGKRASQPEPSAVAESEEVKTEKKAARGAGSGNSDKEKMRRAWAAVLAELKKDGEMRLYALLVKAKVEGLRGTELELSFPEDAAFQMGVLDKAGGLDKVAGISSRLLGKPVSVKLVGARARRSGAKSPEKEKSNEGENEARRAKEKSDVRRDDSSPGDAEPSPENGKSADLARMLSERFDGEVIEKDKE